MFAWRSRSKYSSGGGAARVLERLEVLLGVAGDAGLVEQVAQSVLPLRGVAQTRYERVGGMAVLLTGALHNSRSPGGATPYARLAPLTR